MRGVRAHHAPDGGLVVVHEIRRDSNGSALCLFSAGANSYF